MSMRLILILSVLLLSNVSGADKAAAPAAPAAPAASAAAPAKDEKKKEKGDDEKKDNKMKIGGGLYTTDKVANVKSMKGNRPVSLRRPTFFF